MMSCVCECMHVCVHVRVRARVLYFGACLRVFQDSQDLETVVLNVPLFFSAIDYSWKYKRFRPLGTHMNKFKMHACTVIVTSTSHNHSVFHFRLLKEHGLSYSHLCLFQGWGILPILQPATPTPHHISSVRASGSFTCTSLSLLFFASADVQVSSGHHKAITSTSAEPFLHGSACVSVSGTPGKWISIFLLHVWWDRILTLAI